MTEPSDLIGSGEACRLLQVHPSTLMRWVRESKIVPAFQLPGENGARVFSRAQIERIVAERQASS